MHIRKTLGLLARCPCCPQSRQPWRSSAQRRPHRLTPPASRGRCVAGDNACEPVDPPPTTAPPQVGISSVAPDYGWAGDTVTVQGTVLQGASSVTFAGSRRRLPTTVHLSPLPSQPEFPIRALDPTSSL